MTNEELTKKIFDLDERVTRHTEQFRACFNQIEEIKNIAEGVHKLATTIEILVREQQITNVKVDKLACDVEEIKEKPAKKWDSVVMVILTAIVTAFVTWMLTKIGLT